MVRVRSTSRLVMLLAFAAGAGASPWVAARPAWGLATAALAVAAFRPKAVWVPPAILLLVGLSWGNLRLSAGASEGPRLEDLTARGAAFAWVRGTVEAAEPWQDGSRALIRARSLNEGDRWDPFPCRIRAYLPVPPPVDGSDVEASLRLERPRRATNPGEFDLDAYCERADIDLLGSCRSAELVRPTPPPAWHLLARYRRVVESRLLADTGGAGGSLLALLLGERGLLTPAQVDVLGASGLFHLVALSGFNVALLLLLMEAAAAASGLHPKWRDGLSFAVLAAYAGLVALQPSLARALLMGGLFLTARLLARPHGAGLAWTGALALLLAVDPLWVLDAGFQLTFAATLGILLFWTAYPSWLPGTGWPGWLGRLLWAGFSAQLATLPFLALSFHRVSLIGWLATPLASLPLIGIQALGVAYLLGLGFVPGLHVVLGKAMALLADLFLWLPGWLGRGRIGCAFVAAPAWGWVILYGVGLALLALRGRARRVGWAVAAFALVGAWAAPRPGLQPVTRLTVLDVGQASCQVIESEGQVYLMDAGNGVYRGPSSARTVIEPFLAQAGIRGLSGIFLTHWDADHSGSARDLLRDLPVGFLAYPEADPPRDSEARDLVRLAADHRVSLMTLRAGDAFDLGGLPARVWHPPGASRLTDKNDLSLVVRVGFPGAPVLFTGDLQRGGERSLLAAGAASPVYGLLAPHHGSATSSTPDWVAALRPKLVIFSVGRDNRFGHPAPTVVARYAQMGSGLLRTDRDGAIELIWGAARPLAFRMRDGDLP